MKMFQDPGMVSMPKILALRSRETRESGIQGHTQLHKTLCLSPAPKKRPRISGIGFISVPHSIVLQIYFPLPVSGPV